MKILYLSLLVTLFCPNYLSQTFDYRIFDVNVFGGVLDTCDCSELTIKKYDYNFSGKRKKNYKSVRKKNYKQGHLVNENSYVKYVYDKLRRVIEVTKEGGINYESYKISYSSALIVVMFYECIDSLNCDLNNTTRYYYDNQGNITGKVITGVNHANKVVFFYEYDYNDNLLIQYGGNYKDSTKGKPIIIWGYDNNGHQIKRTEYRPYPSVVPWYSERVYNKKGQEIAYRLYNYDSFFSGRKYEYYENGLKKFEINFLDRETKLDSKYLFEYNDKAYITKVTRINKKGKPISVEVYEYK